MRVCTNCDSGPAREVTIPPTPVPNLINTNAIPSPREDKEIRAMLYDMNSDLSQLDGEIDRVQAILDDLRMKRETLSDACRQHMALISLIRSFPTELLSAIFMLSLPDDWKYNICDFRRAVLLPGSICRHWRDIALSTHRLWSSISLQLVESTAEVDEDMTRAWLARSGGSPLSIRLNDKLTAASVIDLLVEHAERWRDVDLELPSHMLSRISPAKNRLPHLHALSISHPDREPPITPMDVFEFAPQLTSLMIGPNVSFHNMGALWSQLTVISMYSDFSIDQCYEVFSRATNLVECHLRIYRLPLRSYCAGIHHTNLRILSISARVDTGSLFGLLELPALHSFSYTEDYRAGWPQAQFISLLSRSSCSLRELSFFFRSTMLEGDDLVDCLRLTPLLTHLDLGQRAGNGITDSVLLQLTLPQSFPPDEEPSRLVPRLEALDICLYHIVDGNVLATMVESRQSHSASTHGDVARPAHISPLKILLLNLLHIPESLDLLTRSRLRDCEKGGIEVREVQWSPSEDKYCHVPV